MSSGPVLSFVKACLKTRADYGIRDVHGKVHKFPVDDYWVVDSYGVLHEVTVPHRYVLEGTECPLIQVTMREIPTAGDPLVEFVRVFEHVEMRVPMSSVVWVEAKEAS